MGVDSPREDVKSIFFLGYSAIGELPFRRKGVGRLFLKITYAWPRSFLNMEILNKPHPATVRADGLEAILSGLEDLKRGKVSGDCKTSSLEMRDKCERGAE
ncbi:hypothetical protein V1509DRAFT_629835 [Lipomyces kononenkoae]